MSHEPCSTALKTLTKRYVGANVLSSASLADKIYGFKIRICAIAKYKALLSAYFCVCHYSAIYAIYNFRFSVMVKT